MKLPFYLVIFILFQFLFQCSNGSNIIHQSCKEASKNDPNLSYDFCVASLDEAASKNKPPTSLEALVGMSIQLTKSNGTNIISFISKLLKNQTFDQYAKACLQDCFDLYKDSLSSLEDAMVAFKCKDLDTAGIKVSAALDDSVTCEDQFKDKKGEISPLTMENHVYFELNVISLAFIQMFRQHY
ncbi:putative invertase inhibitor [Gastrolobium bilobum]|uniref:putative invertase inhibitor n=1 Tax=Gastrolobium bilobum TaxID=150636 RepID=UPI002AB20455|nr:putative invertase inhibitor [Gastrolobium bilobum]